MHCLGPVPLPRPRSPCRSLPRAQGSLLLCAVISLPLPSPWRRVASPSSWLWPFWGSVLLPSCLHRPYNTWARPSCLRALPHPPDRALGVHRVLQDTPGCGAVAERGQRGTGRDRARSHEKLPPTAFRQGRGRGNSRTRRASARPRSRFKELPWSPLLAGPGLRAAGDKLQGVPGGLSPWIYPSCRACHGEGAQLGAWRCPGGDGGVPTSHRACPPAPCRERSGVWGSVAMPAG